MNDDCVIGVDIGGTHVRAALIDRHGKDDGFVLRPSRAEESAAAPLDAIAELVAELRGQTRRPLIGVGVGSPGAIDPDTGTMVGRTPHLPHWTDFPLRERLAARLGLPVCVDNDANLAALGEHLHGAAAGARVSITVTIGTGVGCGIVAGDRVFRGAYGGAGEIGHLPLGDGSLACRCGIQGCVEPEMSGSGLARNAGALGLAERDAASLFAQAARGETRAMLLIDRLADRLGAAIAIAVNLLNPDAVVIGGGVAQAGEALIGPVRQALDRYALASHRRGLRVVPAALGVRAGTIGAGSMAWTVFGAKPDAVPLSRGTGS